MEYGRCNIIQNINVLFVISIAIILYMSPFISNINEVIATSHNDNSISSYLAIEKYPERYSNDPHAILAHTTTKASLMFYGSNWIHLKTRLPIKYTWLFIQLLQFMSLPIMFAWLFLKTNTTKWWALGVFFSSLLSGYYCWNLGLYGVADIPVPHQFALPFLCLGSYRLIRSAYWSGTLLIIIGCLIHVWSALYVLTALFIYLGIGYRKLDFKLLAALCSVLCVAAAVVVMNSDSRYALISKQETMNFLRVGMHEVPWESPYAWKDTYRNLLAFIGLAILAFKDWGVFGSEYKKLIISSIVMAVLFSLLHLLGLYLEVPLLVQTKGLRAQYIAVIAIFPVVMSYLFRCMEKGDISVRFLATLTFLLMIFYANYGLDKYVVSGLAFCSIINPVLAHHKKSINVINILIFVASLSWCVVWATKPFTSSSHLRDSIYLLSSDKYISNLLVSPSLIKVYVAVFSALFAIAYLVEHKVLLNNNRYQIVSSVMILSSLFCLIITTFKIDLKYSESRDLYHAQLWANKNTSPSDLFIVYNNVWRSFSERPTVYMLPQFNYKYVNDIRLKKYEDRLIDFYGLQDKMKGKMTVKEHLQMFNSAYNGLTEEKFKEFAIMFGAAYLLEKRTLKFPIVYSNSTYKIYRIL